MKYCRFAVLSLCLLLILSLFGCAALPVPTASVSASTRTEPAGSSGDAEAPHETETAALPAADPDFPALTYSLLQGVTQVELEGSVLRVYSDAGDAALEVGDDMLSGSGVSMDGTTAHPELYSGGAYRYFYYDRGSLTELEDWGFYHALSLDGTSAIARVREENRIVIYRQGRPVQTIEDHGVDFVMSPDGSAALWSSYAESDREPMLRLWVDGEVTDLGKNLTPVAVANDGAYVYFRAGTGPLFVQQGTDASTAQLVQPEWVDSLIVFNRDCSEVIAAGRNSAYWSVQGRKAVLVPKDAIHVILPENAVFAPTDSWSGSGRLAGLSTFQGALYMDYSQETWRISQLHWLDGTPVGSQVDTVDWDDVQLSPDGSALVYRKEGGLWRTDAAFDARWDGSQLTPPTLITSDLSSSPTFRLSWNGSSVFYLNSAGALMAWENGESRTVSEKAGLFCAFGRGLAYFSGNDLLVWGGAGSTCLVSGEEALRVLGSTPLLLLVLCRDGSSRAFVPANAGLEP